MNWLFKIAIFSAPVFIISLVVYFAVYKQFQTSFQTENLRFEKQFQREMGYTSDRWLEKQEKQVERLWKEGGDKEVEELERQLEIAIKESEKEKKDEEELRKEFRGR